MKMKFSVICLAAAMLICALAGGALAEEEVEVEDTMTSSVNVQFKEAIFFYDFPDGGGMDVDFGPQSLPLGIATSIPASDGPHTLRVCDRRLAAGKWSVSAIISSLTSGDESVVAYLRLYNPTVSDGLVSALAGIDPDQFAYVNPSVNMIVEAAEELVPGDYDLTATEENTHLLITAEETDKLKTLAYTSTVTWTLTLAP